MTPPFPTPEITPVNKPWWDALAEGTLTFQNCGCGHKWLPPRAECPRCLGNQWTWQSASGRATLVSWTVFHVAYHEALKDRLPYNVAVVELAEGPRMITNVIDSADGRGLRVGMDLMMALQEEGGTAIARFRKVTPG